MLTFFGESWLRQKQQRPASAKQSIISVARDFNNPRPCQVKRRNLAPLLSVVMAAVTLITYAEFYRVVTNDPHEGDLSAVYEDETPVPVGGIRPTPANIVSAVCGDSNPDAYLLFSRGGDKVPYARILLQVTMCPRSQGHASSLGGGTNCSVQGRSAPRTDLRVSAGPGLLHQEGGGAGRRPYGSCLCRGRRRSRKASGNLQDYQWKH